MKHLNHTIFITTDETKFSYVEFTSVKFSNFNDRLSFTVVGVNHYNRGIDIREALKSFDLSKHV